MDWAAGGLTDAQVRQRILGDAGADAAEAERDPILGPFYRLAVEHCYGGVWGRPGLGLKDRGLVTVAVLAALGRTARLARHLDAALDAGWTPLELREACLHTWAYAGIPAAGDALESLSGVVRRRGLAVEEVESGDADGLSAAEVRRKVLGDRRANETQAEPEPLLAPLWTYSIEHAWGAVWVRPGLTFKQRSLVTLSALTGLARREELRLHFLGGMNNGWSAEELREICLHASAYSGVPTAITALHVLSEVAGSQSGEQGGG